MEMSAAVPGDVHSDGIDGAGCRVHHHCPVLAPEHKCRIRKLIKDFEALLPPEFVDLAKASDGGTRRAIQ